MRIDYVLFKVLEFVEKYRQKVVEIIYTNQQEAETAILYEEAGQVDGKQLSIVAEHIDIGFVPGI